MEESLTNIFVEMSEDTKNIILESVGKLSDTKGYYWSYVSVILQTGMQMFRREADSVEDKESKVIADSKADESTKNLIIDQNTCEEKKSDGDSSIHLEKTDASDPMSIDLFKLDSLEDILDRSGFFHAMQVPKIF